MTSRTATPDDRQRCGKSESRRLWLIRWLLVAGLLSAFALAPKLWLDHPLFGTMPVLDGLPRLGAPLDVIIFGILILFVLPIAFMPRARPWIFLWTVLFAARCVWDRITWQPYFYQYFFMMLALAAVDWDQPTSTKNRSALNACRLVIAAIYFWSGVSKCSASFLKIGVKPMLEAVLPPTVAEALNHFSWTVPILEVAIAVALVTSKFRRVGVVGAIAMHCSILWTLGPFALDYNRVVWPWNLVMVGMVLVLFRDTREIRCRDLFRLPRCLTHAAVIFCCALLPALSFVGIWPRCLSFRLYTGSEASAAVCMSQRLIDRLPESSRLQVRPPVRPEFAGSLVIPYWSEHELGAFAPPETGVYLHVGRRLCLLAERPDDLVLLVRSPPHWLTGEFDIEALTCRDLQNSE